ncbi:aminotransferase class V-fold PLP-dependent enzyme [Phyllobacterium sp. YR531]|uniref:aminotransferase class V-fold PLP-dependent enzyme n=1 Tax=Phyllobacterium sp. YR531 TaxID=1144343 RepID=UPI00026F491A|nr:aminotransferase class V-fold PLP-dependent enzyme [Phyllobacterium sp. YR531]EJN05563.1 selenocysteine lyase [Phyllobacterium sp. YR531]
MNSLNIEYLRSEAPGCAVGMHFNHAGSSLPSRAVIEAITDHLHREMLYGPMEAANNVSALLDEVRIDAAAIINALPQEIAFCSSGSAAWGAAFAALPPLRHGDRILVGRHEWGGNLAAIYAAAQSAGANVETIPCKEDGSVDASALAEMINDRVRLVALTWLPANGGLINDAAAIGRVTRAAGVPYFIDAAQALGQLPIDVSIIGCDVLKASCRKFLRGPRGTAILYIRKDFLDKLNPVSFDVLSAPLHDGMPKVRSDARKFETSERSIALVLGLGIALKQARTLDISVLRQRIASLSEALRQELSAINGVSVLDLGTEKSGLVSFSIRDVGPQIIRDRLAAQRITIGYNGVPYTPLDMKARGLNEIARASVSYLNTVEEITALSSAVAVIASNPA